MWSRHAIVKNMTIARICRVSEQLLRSRFATGPVLVAILSKRPSTDSVPARPRSTNRAHDGVSPPWDCRMRATDDRKGRAMSTDATSSRSEGRGASRRLRAGVIGLGAIGRGVAISLARSGHLGQVFDLRPEAIADLDGIAPQESSAAGVARKSDVILVAALDERQVHNALTRDDGILAGAHADTIVVVLSTISVQAVHKFSDLCAANGVDFLDCGVTPSDQAPNNGLVAFLGGPDAVVAQALPVHNAATALADLYAVRLPLTLATKPLIREVFMRNGGAR
jgi:6-phosphogluconate dehydrogenase-like protein